MSIADDIRIKAMQYFSARNQWPSVLLLSIDTWLDFQKCMATTGERILLSSNKPSRFLDMEIFVAPQGTGVLRVLG